MSAPACGAVLQADGVRLRVWAPEHRSVEAVLYAADGATAERTVALGREDGGYFSALVAGAGAGLNYKFRLDGDGPFPDPWSRFQPFGVHGPSQAVADSFAWTDAGWKGVRLEDAVIYELHVGTATPEGTFDALVARLPHLRALGVTVLELMPLADFPGSRNWGYDGVVLRAPSRAYGGPAGLRRLVDAAHRAGLAVLVDLVANHFGPDGNYLGAYAKAAFTSRHRTPWGDAVDYSQPAVRELVLGTAELWVRAYHADGLRLDATHEIHDDSEPHLLQEIAARARAAAPEREVLVIAEDERNDARLPAPVARGGLGLDAVWADDFHHQVRRALGEPADGYYADYSGSAEDLAATARNGWFYRGQRSRVLGRPRGTAPEALDPMRFVHCIQNHDQVGNRAFGDRLGSAVDAAAYRAASALLLLSPCTPLLFMGQEWSASAPFRYFTDHEPRLGKLVTEGRRREFARFASFSREQIPDPQDPRTFELSKPDWSEAARAPHAGVLAWYRDLLSLRASHPCLRRRDRGSFDVRAIGEGAVELERRDGPHALRLVASLRGALDHPVGGGWRVLAHGEEPRFGGTGPAREPLREGRVRLPGPGAVVLER